MREGSVSVGISPGAGRPGYPDPSNSPTRPTMPPDGRYRNRPKSGPRRERYSPTPTSPIGSPNTSR